MRGRGEHIRAVLSDVIGTTNRGEHRGLYIKDAPCLETNGNGWNRGSAKLLKQKAGDRDRTGNVQLPKELAFQDRVPTENQNPVPCVRAVVRHAACIVVHIVLDRYPCTGVQISACGKPGLPVCALPQQYLS